MRPAEKIFDRVNILKVEFRDAEGYWCDLLKCSREGSGFKVRETIPSVEMENITKEDRKLPFVVVFTGHGVILKERGSLPAAVCEKLDSGGDEFIWCEEEGVVTMLRRQQAGACVEALVKAAIVSAALTVSDSGEESKIVAAAERQLAPVLRLRRILTPDRTGSLLTGIFISKIKLPFLTLLLVVLVVNHFRGEKVRAEAAALGVEVAAYERAVGAAGESDRQKAALIADYQRKIPHGFSWICDRIAIGTPKSVTLTSLSLQPVVRKIENGRPVEFSPAKIEISGQAFNTEDVTLFITALTRLNFAREVKMASLDQNKNSGELQFRINIEL